MNKTCVIIAGPTAVGKTSLAISLAAHFQTEILSADSRQCFRELTIGVAKPTQQQLEQVKHYFLNSHSVQEEVNAMVFEQYALDAIDKIFQTNDIAIVAGGTGLYIKAFCEGMDDIPAVDLSLRKSIINEYEEKGLAWLQEQVATLDPLYFAEGETQNPQRMMRALEVIKATGQSILSFQNKQKKVRDFNIIKIGIDLPREELYQNINNRVDAMISEGLIDEVRSLLPYRAYNALQTVGYKEIFDFLDNKISLDKAIEDIKQNTRHYAKRQLTWFRKDPDIQWFSPADTARITVFLSGTT